MRVRTWEGEEAFRQSVCAEIEKNFRASRFRYIDLDQSELLYVFPLSMRGWIAVIGHPHDASYEWVGRFSGDFAGEQSGKYEQSDAGYGCSDAAMRDGFAKMVD